MKSMVDILNFVTPSNGARYGSIPYIFFVKRDLISFQQPPVLLLKRHLLVMLGLIANICHDRICIGLAEGKCAVARLPMEVRELRRLGFNPFGGTGFNHLYHVGDSARPRKAEEQMNVVFRAADLQ